MNPLFFADYGRLSRWYTRLMWAIVVVLVFVILCLQPSSSSGAGSTAGGRATAIHQAARSH